MLHVTDWFYHATEIPAAILLGRGIVANPSEHRHVDTERHVIKFGGLPRHPWDSAQRIVPLAPREVAGEAVEVMLIQPQPAPAVSVWVTKTPEIAPGQLALAVVATDVSTVGMSTGKAIVEASLSAKCVGPTWASLLRTDGQRQVLAVNNPTVFPMRLEVGDLLCQAEIVPDETATPDVPVAAVFDNGSSGGSGPTPDAPRPVTPTPGEAFSGCYFGVGGIQATDIAEAVVRALQDSRGPDKLQWSSVTNPDDQKLLMGWLLGGKAIPKKLATATRDLVRHLRYRITEELQVAFSGAQSSNLAQWNLKRTAQQQEIRRERQARHLAPRVAINAVQGKAKEVETEFLDGHQRTWGGGSGEQEEDDAAGLVLTEAPEFPTVVNPPNAI